LYYLRSGELETPSEQEDEAWSVVIVDHNKDKGPSSVPGGLAGRQGRFTIMQSTDTTEGRHPGRKISYGGQKMVDYEMDSTPSALSPTERSPAAFISRMGTFSRF